MRYAIVRIPEGQFPEGDTAWRYNGQRVRVLEYFEPLTRTEGERRYRNVETPEGATIMPADWLKGGAS